MELEISDLHDEIAQLRTDQADLVELKHCYYKDAYGFIAHYTDIEELKEILADLKEHGNVL